jgi:hypothetical protein
VIELAGNAALARDLAAGGVFVPGCTLALAEECELVVCGASHRLSLPARVVYIDEQRGAGLELIGFSTAMRAQLAELAPATADDDLALPTLCNVELSGDGEDPDPATSGDGDGGASAVPEPHDRDDEYRTLPVPVGAHAAAGNLEPDPDDDLAVPIEEADDQHTVPVWTRSRARLVDDRDPAPSVPGVARSPRASDLGHSDPVFAIASIEADAAFFDAAEAASVEPAAGRPVTADSAPPEARSEAVFDPMPGAAPDAHADLDPDADPEPIPDAIAELDLDADLEVVADAHADLDPDADPEPIAELDLDADLEAVADTHPEDSPDDSPEDSDAGGELGHAADSRAARAPRHVHERLRGLTLVAQVKLAASGELHERIVLERLYGKNVWETLLRNPRLTPPEVSRIARYGSLPRVLLEIILGNATWLQVPEVRRALLANPRLGTDQILKVLRLSPKHELRLAAIQTAYPHAVRQAAKLLLRGE